MKKRHTNQCPGSKRGYVLVKEAIGRRSGHLSVVHAIDRSGMSRGVGSLRVWMFHPNGGEIVGAIVAAAPDGENGKSEGRGGGEKL